MVNAQQWIDRSYPRSVRRGIKKLEINREINTIIQEKLQGSLDLSDFVNLEELSFEHNLITKINLTRSSKLKKLRCGWNRLISLDVSNCNDLEILYCHDNYELVNILLPRSGRNLKELFISLNNLPAQDLTCFQDFVNLEVLFIGGNPFRGSLKPLKNLTKLKELSIVDTNIKSGLEYLPESVEGFYCHTRANPPAGVREIQEQLEPFKIRPINTKFSYEYNWEAWRRNSLIKLVEEKEELERKLIRQQGVSRRVIEELKKDNEQLQNKFSSQEQMIKQYLENQEKEVKELGKQLAQIQTPPK